MPTPEPPRNPAAAILVRPFQQFFRLESASGILLLGMAVLALAWLAIRAGVAVLPSGVSWRQVWGVSLLCGIGFTMALFIASLAFADAALLDSAKVGILLGSFVSGVAGALVLVRADRAAEAGEAAPPAYAGAR